MDLVSLSLSICLMMTYTVCSNDGKGNCLCSDIPEHELTKRPPKRRYPTGNTFRYTCVDGYVRRAGTSNLIRCEFKDFDCVWTTSSLTCIPDPKITPSQPPSTKGTTAASSLKTTHHVCTSPPVATETDNKEATSTDPGILSKHVQDSAAVTSAADQYSLSTFSTNSVNSNITVNSEARTGLGSTTTAVLLCATVVILVLIGISLFYYRRRRAMNFPAHRAEEVIHMNSMPS